MRATLERLSIKTRKSAAVREAMSRATVCDTFAHLRDPPTVERQRDFTDRCRPFVFRTPDGDRSELEVIAGMLRLRRLSRSPAAHRCRIGVGHVTTPTRQYQLSVHYDWLRQTPSSHC